MRGNNIDRILNFDRPIFVPKRLLNEGQFVKAGDIVIAMSSGSADLVGKAAQATEDFSGGFGAFCGVVRSVSDEVFSFFGFFFQTPLYRIRAAGHGKGIGINNLQKTALQTLEVPLAPLAEQHRIVAKVDELMALCDQLENQHNNAAEAHEKLITHLLGTLTQSQNAEDFNTQWQLISKHFDTLFTTEASIDNLKQTLLQLAVMGKLVPQDPNDEPASELLKRIQAEKAKLIAEGKIKKDKPLAAITEEEKQFDLPVGWESVRLNELLSKIGAGSTPLGGKQVYATTGIPFLRSQNVWNEGLRLNDVAYIIPETHQKMLGTHVSSFDLLFNITGASIGRCAIVHDNFDTGNVSQHVVIIRSVSREIVRFLHFVLISNYIQQKVMDVQVGVSREGLSIGKLGQFIIPIPSLSEQLRIVRKVEELMAICDQLKSQITSANQLQQKLADVMVEQAI